MTEKKEETKEETKPQTNKNESLPKYSISELINMTNNENKAQLYSKLIKHDQFKNYTMEVAGINNNNPLTISEWEKIIGDE